MKKRLFISVALALLLTVLASAPVLAAKPEVFEASGEFDKIELPGDVFPAGASDRWVVAERELTGIFLEGGITGEFTLTYKANVELETQAGNLHGWLTVGEDSYVLQVNGKIEPLEVVWVDEFDTYLPKLTINGRWTFIKGARGQGAFSAWLIFIPEGDHVGEIIASAFDLTGKWK